MQIEPVHTSGAPEAIGPYSQAVVAGDLIFCSGQVSLHPETGELIGDTAAEQADRALQNLKAVLEAAGGGMDTVVRPTGYLAGMADYPSVNEVYARYFGAAKPARAAVAVKTLPKNALVEIDCIATR